MKRRGEPKEHAGGNAQAFPLFFSKESVVSLDKRTAMGYNNIYCVILRFYQLKERYHFTMKRMLSRILPWYGVLPILCSVLFNFIVYFGNRPITAGWTHYDLSIPFLDGRIPFQAWAITIYIASYVFWAIGFVLIARDEREVCYSIFSGELIGKCICLLFFLLLPTVMERPSGFEVNTIFDWVTNLIYTLDEPNNLFPSIHCMESWLVVRGVFRCRNLRHPTAWRVFSICMSLAVFASTLLAKQHVFVDVLGGVAVAELGLLLARIWRAGRIFPAMEKRLFPKRRGS